MTKIMPPISSNYPKPSSPNTRVNTPTGQPPRAVPSPGPFAGMKNALPSLPSVYAIFHRPRTAGR